MSSTNMTKYIFGLVGAIILVGAIYGAYLYPKTPANFGTVPQGSTFNTAKFYAVGGINLATPGANATSSSILNNTGNDLYVTGMDAGCEGVGTSKVAYTGGGLAALIVTAATTSVATPNATGNANSAGSVTIATSTSVFAEASTTPIATGSNSINYVWAAGTYMTFTTNATNTAVCTFGVTAISS